MLYSQKTFELLCRQRSCPLQHFKEYVNMHNRSNPPWKHQLRRECLQLLNLTSLNSRTWSSHLDHMSNTTIPVVLGLFFPLPLRRFTSHFWVHQLISIKHNTQFTFMFHDLWQTQCTMSLLIPISNSLKNPHAVSTSLCEGWNTVL